MAEDSGGISGQTQSRSRDRQRRRHSFPSIDRDAGRPGSRQRRRAAGRRSARSSTPQLCSSGAIRIGGVAVGAYTNQESRQAWNASLNFLQNRRAAAHRPRLSIRATPGRLSRLAEGRWEKSSCISSNRLDGGNSPPTGRGGAKRRGGSNGNHPSRDPLRDPAALLT